MPARAGGVFVVRGQALFWAKCTPAGLDGRREEGSAPMSFRAVITKRFGRERRLDHVGGAQMDPVVFGKAIEGHHPLPVAAHGLGRLGVKLAIARGELVAQSLALRAALGLWDIAWHCLRLGPCFFRQMIECIRELVIPAMLLFASTSKAPTRAWTISSLSGARSMPAASR
jgi:hypothetical protein